jgi:hypothetical protein
MGRIDASAVFLDLPRSRYATGETVYATVHGAASAIGAALLRMERRPGGRVAIVVAQTTVAQSPGCFELAIPRTALPSATGARCALSYLVQARTGAALVHAGIEVRAEAQPHIAGTQARPGPLVAGWDARHFHLELDDAELRGGGHIAGRVHHRCERHSSRITVSASCAESWRPGGPAARGMPFWPARNLWEAIETVELHPGECWARFAFELPVALPPAVEARMIAWRYELRARRQVRYRPDETAALTPLLYEESTAG